MIPRLGLYRHAKLARMFRAPPVLEMPFDMLMKSIYSSHMISDIALQPHPMLAMLRKSP